MYFKVNDAESLREQIVRLTSDRELCSRYAALAYERALKRFTCERMVEDYLNLYEVLTPSGVAVG